MKICYVNRTTVTLYENADTVMNKTYKDSDTGVEETLVVSSISDEGLYGMPLLVLEESGDYYKVRTHYSYEAYVPKNDVIFKENVGNQMVVNSRFVDVLSIPKVQGVPYQNLTVGCLIEVTDTIVDGYRKVVLLDGREGFVPDKYLMPKLFCTEEFKAEGTAADDAAFKAFLQAHLDQYFGGSEEAFREALAETAQKYYVGTQYRWGGKSPLGIDCSGTTSMTYMLNGILTYRDARIVEGYPVKEIPRSEMKKGDLLYFKGHIALYLGDDLFIHSTARTGSNGVDYNSFNPNDKRYRKDLDEGLLKVGTIFW
jgi:hypothetical protein